MQILFSTDQNKV